MYLLTQNRKLQKSAGLKDNWHIMGLSLSPHNSSGRQVCKYATSCTEFCVLEHVGHSVMPSVKQARQRKTDWFFDDRTWFKEALGLDAAEHQRRCERNGVRCGVRLNVGSDLPWERIFPELFERFPGVTWYDYTKWPNRATPANYHLTYSVSERDRASNNKHVLRYLEAGSNVSIVCDVEYNPAHHRIGKLQQSITIGGKRYKTVDGDRHDLRIPETDGRGRVVLLRYKGSLKSKDEAIKSGFCWSLPRSPGVQAPLLN